MQTQLTADQLERALTELVQELGRARNPADVTLPQVRHTAPCPSSTRTTRAVPAPNP
jgi:hypothetical protein